MRVTSLLCDWKSNSYWVSRELRGGVTAGSGDVPIFLFRLIHIDWHGIPLSSGDLPCYLFQ